MVSFVVETYLPGHRPDRFAAEAAGIRRAALAAGPDGHVRVLKSYMVPDDEMGFHVVEADSAEAVSRVAALAAIEVERIVEAIGVGPDHPDLTPIERSHEGSTEP